jgi:hypothetical protein
MSEPLRNAAQPAPKKRRSGSEKRQRQAPPISVRVTDTERAKIEANAAALDLCASAFLRTLGTGQERAKERRRPMPELKPFTQAMGRLGIYASNAHQLLKLANRGDIVHPDELSEACKNLDAAATELLRLIREAK